MASIIPGYQYDIFISYRQKDNKHDGWVTEFVNNLKGELESTFKEEISVYFDINPHDGLLETHDVNASLKEKLKCLVFIPIISQTYCDSKSFAWQHEFVAFNKIAQGDLFGRDIRLSSGNVASRILPVKIHDLDEEDKSLLENELGGVLRSIDFIYKASGVNRPLKPNDERTENLNHTYYRDQINKVANAVKEIITAIKKYGKQNGTVSKEVVKTKSEKPKNLKPKIIIGSFFVLAILVLGYFIIPKLSNSSKPVEKSIAVLPFRNLSNDTIQLPFCDGFMEDILNDLQKVNSFTVRSRTSSDQYRDTKKSSIVIGNELNVNYLVEGSFEREGDNLKIWVSLIDSKADKQMWSNDYPCEVNQIFSVQSEIAKEIASELKEELTPEEIKKIEKRPTENVEAYNFYIQGRFYYNKFAGADNFNKAIYYFKEAIKIEPDYALAYAGIASSYMILWVYNYLPPEKCLPQMEQAVQQCLKFDNEIAECHIVMARMKMYYDWDFAAATIEYKKALELNPNLAEAHDKYAICLGLLGNFTEAVKHASIAYSLDPFSPMINENVATVYWLEGDYDKEVEYGRRLIEFEPNFYGGYMHVGRGLMYLKRYKEAVYELDTAVQKNPSSLTFRYLGVIYAIIGEKVKTREVLEKMEDLRKTHQWVGDCDIGVVYMALGESDKAFKSFEKAIEKHEGFMLYLKYYIRLFPEFEKDPRTKQILERIGLPYQ